MRTRGAGKDRVTRYKRANAKLRGRGPIVTVIAQVIAGLSCSAVSTSIFVRAFSAPSAVSANDTTHHAPEPPAPAPAQSPARSASWPSHHHHSYRLLRSQPHRFGHRGRFPPISRAACQATYAESAIVPSNIGNSRETSDRSVTRFFHNAFTPFAEADLIQRVS
jgi:hypothetical protein